MLKKPIVCVHGWSLRKLSHPRYFTFCIIEPKPTRHRSSSTDSQLWFLGWLFRYSVGVCQEEGTFRVCDKINVSCRPNNGLKNSISFFQLSSQLSRGGCGLSSAGGSGQRRRQSEHDEAGSSRNASPSRLRRVVSSPVGDGLGRPHRLAAVGFTRSTSSKVEQPRIRPHSRGLVKTRQPGTVPLRLGSSSPHGFAQAQAQSVRQLPSIVSRPPTRTVRAGPGRPDESKSSCRNEPLPEARRCGPVQSRLPKIHVGEQHALRSGTGWTAWTASRTHAPAFAAIELLAGDKPASRATTPVIGFPLAGPVPLPLPFLSGRIISRKRGGPPCSVPPDGTELLDDHARRVNRHRLAPRHTRRTVPDSP